MFKTADINDTPLTSKPLPTQRRAEPFKEISTLKTATRLGSWIDVSQMKLASDTQKFAHQKFCLPSQSKYPIDDLRGIKLANAYFDRHYLDFDPPTRREYAHNLLKVASPIKEEVSPLVRVYGSDKLASDIDISASWRVRAQHIDNQHRPLLDKVASKSPRGLAPDDYACLMFAFDKVAGLPRLYDNLIYDPWRTVLAEEEVPSYFSEVIGVDTILQDDISHLASSEAGQTLVKRKFGHEFLRKFLNDPLGTYKGLSTTERQILGRSGRTLRCGGPIVRP